MLLPTTSLAGPKVMTMGRERPSDEDLDAQDREVLDAGQALRDSASNPAPDQDVRQILGEVTNAAMMLPFDHPVRVVLTAAAMKGLESESQRTFDDEHDGSVLRAMSVGDVAYFRKRVAEWREMPITGHGLYARYQDAQTLLADAESLLHSLRDSASNDALAALRRLDSIANEGPTDDELSGWKRDAARYPSIHSGAVLLLAAMLQNVRSEARRVLASYPTPEGNDE